LEFAPLLVRSADWSISVLVRIHVCAPIQFPPALAAILGREWKGAFFLAQWRRPHSNAKANGGLVVS